MFNAIPLIRAIRLRTIGLQATVAFAAVCGLHLSACGGDKNPASPSQEMDSGTCAYDENATFLVTYIERDDNRSNTSFCPQLTPEQLNGQLDAGSKACTVTPHGCTVDVACLFQGFMVNGTLERNGSSLDGEFSVEKLCVYLVSAELANP